MKLDWKPIKTAPVDGKCLLAILSDDGWTYAELQRNSKGHWIHEGEPTFCHGYYFEPIYWTELPEDPPMPEHEEDDD